MEVKLEYKNKVALNGRVESLSWISDNLPLFPVLILGEGGKRKRKGGEEGTGGLEVGEDGKRRGRGKCFSVYVFYFVWLSVLCQKLSQILFKVFSKFQNL